MLTVLYRHSDALCRCNISRLVLINAFSVCQRLKKQVDTPKDRGTGDTVMRVLNVAEKNDAAKNLAKFMSSGRSRMREGFSRFNKIYEWNSTLLGQACTMTMTSVSGHLLTKEFGPDMKSWARVPPLALFDAPVLTVCPPDFVNIKRTLQREARQCDTLVIWTDCDREGENIGFEVIEVCKEVNPRLQIYRATFSEITATSVARALRELGPPNKAVSDAVNVRMELDLRIGAAFTRFQSLRLQNRFPDLFLNQVVSYGSCQFPTLGFVVERFKAHVAHVPEPHWRLQADDTRKSLTVEFRWQRGRLFDRAVVEAYHDACVERPRALVTRVQSKPKSKWRPLPLDTVEMEKLSSRKLRMGAKEAMRVAEKLYSAGYISYPRTETNIFPKGLDLAPLVREQTGDRAWGAFAQRLAERGPTPRAGRKSDQAHPPIHPIKYTAGLQGNEKTLYEFIVRHFLACCSDDAKGLETTVDIRIADEMFTATGLLILERNYLDVYPYDRWTAKEIHEYREGETFDHAVVSVQEGQTTAPALLTEADLIALMEKHGIGTDATHAEHIEKIKMRGYVSLEGNSFVPQKLGMALVDGYDAMRLLTHGDSFSKPRLRAELEAALVQVCERRAVPAEVLRSQTAKYKAAFEAAMARATEIDAAVVKYMRGLPDPADPRGGGHNRGGGGGGGGDNDDDDFPPPPPPPHPMHPHCDCRAPAQELTVRKEGANLGRRFFKCASSACPFFAWREDVVGLPPAPREEGGQRGGQNAHRGGQNAHRGGQNANFGGQNANWDERNANFGGQNGNRGEHSTNRGGQSENRGGQSENRGGRATNRGGRATNRGGQSANRGGRGGNGGGVGGGVNCSCGAPAKSAIVTKAGPNKGRRFLGCSRDASERCNFFEWDDAVPDEQDDGGSDGREVVKRKRRCGICQQEGHTRNKCPRK